jgi:hypothetical protein
MEEQALFDQFDLTLTMKQNPLPCQQVVSTYICPSAPSASRPIFEDRSDAAALNPNPALGLYYPVSMGPTEPDVCPFCPEGSIGTVGNYCCQGRNYGTRGYQNENKDSSTGIYGRFDTKREFKDISDGLSHTLLAGETLPSQCVYVSAFAPNFSLAGTSIPLNTFETCPQPPGCHSTACGFKSAHRGGVSFLLGDGSVHFFPQEADYRVVNQMGTRAGEEPVAVPN